MFILFTGGSGSPLQARKTAPLFSTILILALIIAIIVAISILIKKITEYRHSQKFIEKEKSRCTKYYDVLKYAKKNKLSAKEKNILWDVCQAAKWNNILYSLKDNASVNELFKTAYFKLQEKKYFTDVKLNLFFKLLFKIELIVAQYKKLISSRQIPLKSIVFYISDEGEQYPFSLLENTKDYFAVELPSFFANSERKPQLLHQYRFTYKTVDGLSHNFVTRIMRYDISTPDLLKAIIAHTDNLECQTFRKFKREFFEEKCRFSAIAFTDNDKKEYTIKGEPIEAKITNISGGGCCIRTNLPIKENQPLCVHLDSIGIENEIIGLIKKTRKLPNGTYSLHIQFINLPIPVQNKILLLVYKYIL